MSIEFDGITFPSAEARAYFINMDPAARQKWREEHAPMTPPLPTDIIVAQPRPQSELPSMVQIEPGLKAQKRELRANRADMKTFLQWRYGDRPSQIVYSDSWC